MDDVFEVLVYDDASGAEYDEVEIHHGKRGIEVRLLKDGFHAALTLGEPGADHEVVLEVLDLELEPRAGGRGDPGHHARGQHACRQRTGRVDDVLVDRRAAVHLVGDHQPTIPSGQDEIGQFAPVQPPRIAPDAHP